MFNVLCWFIRCAFSLFSSFTLFFGSLSVVRVSSKLALWVGVLGCGDTPVNVVSLLVRLRGRGARLWRHPG